MEDRTGFVADPDASTPQTPGESACPPNKKAKSKMGIETDTEIRLNVSEGGKKIVDEFLLVAVLDDSGAAISAALEKLWNAGIKKVGHVRGRTLSELFEGLQVTETQKTRFAEAMKPLGVYFD